MTTVTVLMPVYNEEEFIERSLGSVLAQDYPADRMDVLVVDGRSTDRTREVVERIAQTAPVPVRLLDNPRKIQAAALNVGLAEIDADLIVRVDGHCTLEPDYVRRCVEVSNESKADNVGGRQDAVGQGPVGRAVALATTSPFGIGNAAFHYAKEPAWVDTVYLGAFRRDVFDRIGGFSEDVGPNEDDDLNLRLRRAGGRIRLDPSIRSTYYCRRSLSALWRQYYRFGVNKIRVMRKQSTLPNVRMLVPPLFVLGLVASVVAAIATGWWPLAFVAIGPYVLVAIAASLLAARRDPGGAILLPGIFLAIHLAYGVGVISGFLKRR